MSPIRWAAGGVALAAVALIVVFATSPNAANVQAQTPLIGKTAPALSGKSLTQGGEVSMGSLKGQFVLVNFFASWCGPCKAEEAQLVDFAAANRSTTVVVGVDIQESGAVGARFVTQHGGHYPVITDTTVSLDSIRWGVRSPPTSFLVAPNGKIVTKLVGQVTTVGLDRLVGLAQAKGY